ncbi:MAG: RluA family pseudouridine synthase [Pirellulales bacterium]|jgi:tRNA pseudouridine32 synthase/23S rRNA pseudouridine746 synthase
MPSIVHRDDRLLVLDKPSGLLAVPGRGPDLQDCLARRVQELFPTALVVHRLDRDTSGLMLMALDADAQRDLSRQFEQRQVKKHYHCIVRGVPEHSSGLIDQPIARDPARPPRYRIDHETGRPSQTRWRVLERLGDRARLDRARLDVEPITGRSHQIRLHLATLGHPILGDPLYGDDETPADCEASLAPRLLLHATLLAVTHPADGRRVEWRSTCPF